MTTTSTTGRGSGENVGMGSSDPAAGGRRCLKQAPITTITPVQEAEPAIGDNVSQLRQIPIRSLIRLPPTQPAFAAVRAR